MPNPRFVDFFDPSPLQYTEAAAREALAMEQMRAQAQYTYQAQPNFWTSYWDSAQNMPVVFTPTNSLSGAYRVGVDSGGQIQSLAFTPPGLSWLEMPIGDSPANHDQANAGAPARPPVVEAPERTMLKRVPVEVQDLDLSHPRQVLAAAAEDLLGYMPLRQELRTPGSLKRALAKLEIEILDQTSVDRYKAQMTEHYRTAGKMKDPTWRLTKLGNYTQPVPEFVLQKAVEIKRELPAAAFYVDQLAVDPFLIVSLEPLKDWVVNAPSRALDPETAAYVEVWSEPKFESSL
jgi:hypothetical protein